MNLNRAMASSSSGLHAERFRMDVISSNIANANSISANGTPAYRRSARFMTPATPPPMGRATWSTATWNP